MYKSNLLTKLELFSSANIEYWAENRTSNTKGTHTYFGSKVNKRCQHFFIDANEKQKNKTTVIHLDYLF